MSYQIFVHGFNNRTLICEVLASTSVARLKENIQQQTNISPHDQRLIYQGTQLEDEDHLSDYGISAFATVHLSGQLNGGGLGYMHFPPNLRQLAEKYKSEKLVCRKCYARLPLKATNCRKCHSNELRKKHKIGEGCKV